VISGIDAAKEIYARYGIHCIFLSANLDAAARDAVSTYDPVELSASRLASVLRRALEKALRSSSS
jgi:hypothetical protein